MSKNKKNTSIDKIDYSFSNNDWFLQLLVSLVNGKSGVSFSITLNIGGSIISGDMISGQEYFETFADSVSKGLELSGLESVAPRTREAFLKFAEIYNKDNPNDNEINKRQPSFIHLKNTKFFHPGKPPIPDGEGFLWRGRISEIGGFSLGKLV